MNLKQQALAARCVDALQKNAGRAVLIQVITDQCIAGHVPDESLSCRLLSGLSPSLMYLMMGTLQSVGASSVLTVSRSIFRAQNVLLWGYVVSMDGWTGQLLNEDIGRYFGLG